MPQERQKFILMYRIIKLTLEQNQATETLTNINRNRFQIGFTN